MAAIRQTQADKFRSDTLEIAYRRGRMAAFLSLYPCPYLYVGDLDHLASEWERGRKDARTDLASSRAQVRAAIAKATTTSDLDLMPWRCKRCGQYNHGESEHCWQCSCERRPCCD